MSYQKYKQLANENFVEQLPSVIQVGSRHQFHNYDKIWNPNSQYSEHGLYEYKTVSGTSDVQQSDIYSEKDAITSPPKTPFVVEHDAQFINDAADGKVELPDEFHQVNGTVVPPYYRYKKLIKE